jgi:hypothetical protein
MAVPHRGSRHLEVIWRAIPKSEAEYARRFRFHFDGREYVCEFASASERLSRIVEWAAAVEPVSHTNFRNLIYIKEVVERMNQVPADPALTDYVLTPFSSNRNVLPGSNTPPCTLPHAH